MSLKVYIRGLSGETHVELPDGSTVADLREAAGLAEELSLRINGQTASDETPVENEAVAVTTAPAPKHG